jgi:hypothetical protein
MTSEKKPKKWGARKTEKVSDVMLNALRRVERGLDLAGHYSAKTIRSLRNRNLIEGAYSLTDAGREVLTTQPAKEG